MSPMFNLRPLAAVLLIAGVFLWRAAAAGAPSFSGGFIEKSTSTAARPRLTQAQIQSFVPSGRGKFKFPSPYNTEGVRLTIPADCGGNDCLFPLGYSYWSNINNHAGSDTMLILIGLERKHGGTGPTLFSYHKTTDEVKNLGPLFPPSSPFYSHSGDGWYFSATQPAKLYISNSGAQLQRYDVLAKKFETVFDVTEKFGKDKSVAQTHSSGDDRVHSATLQCVKAGCSDGANTAKGDQEAMGCLVYNENTRRFSYYPKKKEFDECQIDKSGRWLFILEQWDGLHDMDNRIVDLDTGKQRTLLSNQQNILATKFGAVVHVDMGYGYVVGGDSADSRPYTKVVYNFAKDSLDGVLAYYATPGSASSLLHIAHGNAKPNVPPEQQYACGSGAGGDDGRRDEIICFRLDGSLNALPVAPVMTDLKARGGDIDGTCGEYCKHPKGNIDVTGRYFIWTSNMSGNRLDAFIVKIPAQLLVSKQP
jgi:hypothetical protein